MRAVLIMTVAVLAACGDSSSEPRIDTSHHGTFTLRTVNEAPPPVTVYQDANGRIQVVSGAVTLNSDGTFVDRTDWRIVSGTQTFTETDITAGTYERSGGTIQLRSTEGEVYSASFSGENTLTRTIEGFVVVYRK